MKSTDPASSCLPRVAGRRLTSCVDAMAEGWINVTDLCQNCTRWLVRTVDQAAGRKLQWHEVYSGPACP